MQKVSSGNRSAFTMLELIVVMVLLGLVSAIAMVSVVGHIEQSELARIAQQIANADRKEREATRLSPFPGGLAYEPSKQRLQYLSSGQRIEMASRVKIAEFVAMRNGPGSGDVLFNQSGQSQTYAIRLQSQRGATQWILIVGMTGQVIVSDHTEQVRALLALGS